jgi:hypothetical protein
MRLSLGLLLAAAAFAQPPAQPPLARLEGNIQRVINSVNATWGIYVKCLETRANSHSPTASSSPTP